MVTANLANSTCEVIEGINRAISTTLSFFRIVLVNIAWMAFAGVGVKDFVALAGHTTIA